MQEDKRLRKIIEEKKRLDRELQKDTTPTIETVKALRVVLTHAPFFFTPVTAWQVCLVLHHGIMKHKKKPIGPIIEQLEHALTHAQEDGNEDESGSPHWAHVACRAALLLMRLGKDVGK